MLLTRRLCAPPVANGQGTVDGIGDYTLRLGRALAAPDREVEVATLDPLPVGWAAPPDANLTVTSEGASLRGPGWVVLQYNPFSYGRWGVSPRLCSAWRRWGATGLRRALMIHEPFVPGGSGKQALLSLAQQYQLRWMGARAEALFCSIQPWCRRFDPWFRRPVRHLPVGSAIAFVPHDRAAVRSRLGIDPEALVLGHFGTLHPSRSREALAAALRAVPASEKPTLLYVGPDAAALHAPMQGLRWVATGSLPEGEVSATLQAMDLYLAPFSDGVSTRRSSVMAALAHGVAVVGTRGFLTDELLHGVAGLPMPPLLLAGDMEEWLSAVRRVAGDAALRQQLGRAGREFYGRHFDWPVLAATLLAGLRDAEKGG